MVTHGFRGIQRKEPAKALVRRHRLIADPGGSPPPEGLVKSGTMAGPALRTPENGRTRLENKKKCILLTVGDENIFGGNPKDKIFMTIQKTLLCP